MISDGIRNQNKSNVFGDTNRNRPKFRVYNNLSNDSGRKRKKFKGTNSQNRECSRAATRQQLSTRLPTRENRENGSGYRIVAPAAINRIEQSFCRFAGAYICVSILGWIVLAMRY